MNRRRFFQFALAACGGTGLAKASIATDRFEEWYEAKSSMDYFVSNYFQVRGPGGKPGRARLHKWLNMITEGDTGNRYLLKLRPGDEIATMLAAVVAHRLVFFSGIHVGLLANGGVASLLAGAVEYGLATLPPWMFADGRRTLQGSLELPNGNRFTTFHDPGVSRFTDLLIYGVDRVAESTILGSVLAARGGFVVMTTAKQSYRAPVDCVELRPEAFDRLFSALDGR